MRFFVTGALGFIGAHFIDRALAEGHTVLGLYRSASGRKERLLRSLTDKGAHLKRGDVLDPNSYRPLLTGVECVCHFAAAFNGPFHSEQEFHDINVKGTEALLLSAADCAVQRLVFCSTAGIYGQHVPGIIDESATPQPWNAYERSKHAAEERVRTLASQRQMQFVILRPAVVYGPGDERLLKLFRSASKGQFPLFGSGRGRRHMIHVSDVANAFLLACTRDSAANQEMIVAGPEAVPLCDLLKKLATVLERRRCGPRLPLAPMLFLAAVVEDLCRWLGVRPPISRRRMGFYISDAAFDCTRAKQLMGWEPVIGLSEGLQDTCESYEGGSLINRGRVPSPWSLPDAPARD
ncbi:MAG: NAD(P)-dependent oxidoreductase [Steroidobacteraceae bacterium]